MTDYKPITNAYNRQTKILDECHAYIPQSSPISINMQPITDILITTAGRFCEHNVSDILVDLKTMSDIIKSYDQNSSKEHIICFGIRKDGVDGNEFLRQRIENDLQNNLFRIKLYYRKILAVNIYTDKTNHLGCELNCVLKDITDSFTLSDFE